MQNVILPATSSRTNPGRDEPDSARIVIVPVGDAGFTQAETVKLARVSIAWLVVATVVAGAIGVMGAVALVKAPFVTDYFRGIGLVDLPPFPVGAVVTGLLAATLVGVLAGALPAIIATRIKVIDAIRS